LITFGRNAPSDGAPKTTMVTGAASGAACADAAAP
jgi:hypothetical protein